MKENGFLWDCKKLLKYAKEIILFNKVHNLVATSDLQTLLEKHLADSLLAAPFIEKILKATQSATLCDVGSGAGLPGIPLAISFPTLSVTLIEKQAKRVNFLLNEVALLPLQNTRVLQEDFATVKETFDITTFRAFSPLTEPLLKSLRALTKKGGKIVAYKGKMQKALEELGQAKVPPAFYKIVQLSAERCLVLIDN